MAVLSVIVTSYNIESYIGACLDSITNQTLRDLEIIVVDDGSTDASPRIIAEYAEADPRIVPVLRGTNSPGGVATAANAGLDVATAPYVGFADGDDLYEPEMFERLLTAATTHDADLAMCKYRLFTDASEERTAPPDEHRWDAFDQEAYRLDDAMRIELLRFIAVPWRKIYRRSLLEDNGIRFPVGDYFYEDNPFHWFCVTQAESVALVPEVLCHHRLARAGQTMSTADERLFRIFEHHDTIYDFLDRKGWLEVYQTTLLAWAMSQMEWISRRTPANLRRQLYEVLRRVYSHYTEVQVGRAIAEAGKGVYARRLSEALVKDNYPRFVEALEQNAKGHSPVVRGWYHLRYSGPRRTARIAARFVGQQVSRHSPVKPAKLARRSRVGVGTDEVLFALAVLERRIATLEQAVRDQADRPADQGR